MRIILDLLRGVPQPLTVLELCCGEGLLASLILAELEEVTYLGMDGSKLMLEKAKDRLADYTGHFQLRKFELADFSWRSLERPVQAVISSLAIHHLDGEGKQVLFRDVYRMLVAEGVFIVADIIEPANAIGRSIAADLLDEVVRQRSLELDGNTGALDFFLGEKWNTYRFFDPEDIDHPSRIYDQLRWLEEAGFVDIDVHFLQAGHALFSGWKQQ